MRKNKLLSWVLCCLVLFPCAVLGHGDEEDVQEETVVAPTLTSSTTPPIAGVPYEKAVAVLQNRLGELKQIPGVQDAGLGEDGIYVYAEEWASLPLALDGLPVKRLPLMGVPVAGRSYIEAEAVLTRHRAALERLPRVQGVALSKDGIAVYTDSPEQLPPALEGIPVVAIEPMGVPINGIPVMDVEDIFKRYDQTCRAAVPGCKMVRLGPDGMHVYTIGSPAHVPSEVEGVPVKAVVFTPPEGETE